MFGVVLGVGDIDMKEIESYVFRVYVDMVFR